MKKIIHSCSALALCASFSTIFAGGIEPIALLPSDFFSGVTIGLIGSFWHNSWNVDGAGIIDCEHAIGQEIEQKQNEFGTCVTPLGKSAVGESGGETETIFFGPLIESVSIGTFANNGDAIDKTGAIGGQLTVGKVLSAHSINYYLGIYGGGQWGDSNDSITYTENTKNLRALFDLATIGFIFNRFNPESFNPENPNSISELFIDAFKQSARAQLNTQVKMENVYNVGAQCGLLLTPATMAYTKFGVAWSEISANTSFNIDFPELPLGFKSGTFTSEQAERRDFIFPINLSGTATTAITKTTTGYEIGAGVSQAITQNLILSLEYVFRDFGQVQANQGDIFIPKDLLTADKTLVFEEGRFGTITFNLGEVVDPLFYQAIKASAKLHQSAFNAVLAYRFNWLN